MKKKMANKPIIPTYEQFIFEGKYDKLTGIFTKQIFKYLKMGIAIYNIGAENKLGGKDEEGFFGVLADNPRGLYDSDLFLRFKFNNSIGGAGFYIDGGAWNEPNAIPGIEVTITLNLDKVPKLFNQLNANIQDVIRHELEHLTQGGPNKKPFRPRRTGIKTRNKISIEKGNVYKYFILRDEIPAMCHGMYRKAKVEKIPLDEAFDENLDILIAEDLISKKEKIIILKKWFEYSLKKLPAAQYTDKYKDILDKLRKK